LALSVDIGLVERADGLAESTNELKSRLAKALVGVAVIIVSRRTVVADTFDPNIFRLADALSGNRAVVFVGAFAGNNGTGLGVLIIGFTRETLGTGALNYVESLGAITLSAVEVVDLVASTLNSAYSLVDIVNLTIGARCAEVVDQVESGLADASS